MQKLIIAAALLASSVTSPAQPGSYSKLTGEFVITGKDVIDPPAGQKPDRLGLFLEGESAKRTYEAMKAKPTNGDVCEEGMRLKQAGGLTCARYKDGTYSCSVAILLGSGETRPIDAC